MLFPPVPVIQLIKAPTQEASIAKVVLNGNDRLAIELNGQRIPIKAHFDSPDGYLYRVETDDFTSLQQVYFWGVTEWHDLEDENGKYYELAAYHIELDPKHPEGEVEKPNYLGFWGKRSQRGSIIEFQIVKLNGMTPFKQPQKIRFHLVR